jgi:hypothetical protein
MNEFDALVTVQSIARQDLTVSLQTSHVAATATAARKLANSHCVGNLLTTSESQESPGPASLVRGLGAFSVLTLVTCRQCDPTTMCVCWDISPLLYRHCNQWRLVLV